MFKKQSFEFNDEIYNFGLKDIVVSKVRDFYKDDPFPNYQINDNKYTIQKAGDKNHYTKYLKNFLGYGKSFIEVGAGTCQLSNYLSIGNNNSITAFDGNLNSIKVGKTFAKKNNIKNINFVVGDIFDDIFKDEFFDIVLCNGVLHHTKDAYKGFQECAKWLKKEGYIVIGLYNKYGRARTLIRKFFFKFLGKKYLMIFDPVLRKINNKSIKKINAWIKDQYKHPVETTHTFDEVLNWFDKNNIEFINSFPNCEFFESDNEDVFKKLYFKKSRSTFVERFLSQITMIFTRPGSEGGLFLFVGRKLS